MFILSSEVNLIWSFHQMHHSSEQYNLTTALRQSALQKFGSWVRLYILYVIVFHVIVSVDVLYANGSSYPTHTVYGPQGVQLVVSVLDSY